MFNLDQVKNAARTAPHYRAALGNLEVIASPGRVRCAFSYILHGVGSIRLEQAEGVCVRADADAKILILSGGQWIDSAANMIARIRARFDRIVTATIHRPSRFNENALQVSDEDNAPDVYTVEALAYQPEQEAGLTPYELDNMRNYWPRLTLDAMRERVCMCVKQDDYIRVRNERTQRTVKVKTVLALDLAMYFHKFA